MKTFSLQRSFLFALTPFCALSPAVLEAQNQVTVNFNNRVLTGPFLVNAPIYGPDGNGLVGSGFSAALFGGPAGAQEGQLVWLANTTFRTQTALAGFVVPVLAPLPALPVPSSTFTFQVRAWDNRGGTVTSWTQTLSDPTVVVGRSGLFTPPPQPGASSITLVGLTSFSIGPLTPGVWVFRQPRGTNVLLNGKLSLDVALAGSAPLSVQWQLYGTNLPGETSLTLVRDNVRFEDAGPYTVVAANFINSVTSEVALVTIPPRLLQPRPAGSGMVELPFESAAGRSVSLEMKTSLPLAEGPWTILATTNSPTVRGGFLDSHATDPKRYYRLRLEP